MTNAIPKSVTTKKSVKLLSEERSKLKSIRKNFDTAQEFADYLQVDRITIGRIMTIGRGSE